MTKRERERLHEAIRLLKTDDGWDAAMDILLPMAGLYSPAQRIAREATLGTIEELERRHGHEDREFGAGE